MRGSTTPGRLSPGRRMAVALAVLAVAGCERAEEIIDRYRDLTPHEAYAASLEEAGLGETALGRAWVAAASAATASPSPVPVPHREVGYLAPEDPGAVGLRFALARGQVVRIDAELADGGVGGRLFLDLFRLPEDPEDPLRPVQRAEAVERGLVYEPLRSGEFVVRLQPELLRGGRYRLTVAVGPSLDFPVDGQEESAIQSWFGAPRDGGRRDHHGVDIFAPRGTPVLAAAPGVVSRVQETSRGGRVVWLRDTSRNQSLYYAHLDRQLVESGQRVRPGDTLGLVGNTGNARTTPPHLHFGIYRRGEGPLDPEPFLRRPRRPLPGLPDEELVTPGWRRSSSALSLLRTPDGGAEAVTTVAPATPMRVLAGAGGWLRVRLPDGRSGWVSASRTQEGESALGERTASASDSLRAAPSRHAPAIGPMEPGSSVAVLGAWDAYLWVRTPAGAHGWLAGSP